MERTLANLKKLPNIQLPSQAPRTVTLPKIEAVPQLPRLAIPGDAAIEAERKRLLAAQEEAAALAKEKEYKSLTGVKDANDPYVVNSLADAIFNRKGKEKRYGGFAEFLHKIPVLGDAVTAVVAAVDTTIVSPMANLLTGDFKALGINTLTNFSETMDILANPVKSLITPLVNEDTSDPKYQMPWYKRLGASFGFTSEGRYNYDYDTGFWLSDIGLEIISDPTFVVNVIAGTISGVGKAIGKSATKAILKETGSEIAEEVAEKAVKSGLKVINEVGEEITEATLKETITKQFTSEVVKKTLDLRRITTDISKTAKKLSKISDNTIFRELAQELDVAISATKSITDDTIKSIITQILENSKIVAKESLSKESTMALKELLNLVEEFNNISSYSLNDFILNLFGSATENTNKILSKSARTKSKSIIKSLKDVELTPQEFKSLQEQLNILFSDPDSIKRYAKILNVDDLSKLMDNLKEIPFSDYLDKTNAFVQRNNQFKLAAAMDKLGEGTQAVDSAIFKAAIHSSAPLVPFAMSYLKPGLGFIKRSISDSKFGKYTSGFLQKRIESVDTFFRNKYGNATALVYEHLRDAFGRVFKEFDLFSGSKLAESGFEKELAQAIYQDTYNWLRGFGNVNRYTYTLEQTKLLAAGASADDVKVRPINILTASKEEQVNQIWGSFATRLQNLDESIQPTDTDKILDIFYREVDRMGQLGFGTQELEDWSLSTYLSQIRVTEAIEAARNAYKDFDEILGKSSIEAKSEGSILMYSKDVELSKGVVPGTIAESSKLLDELGLDIDDVDTIKTKLRELIPASAYPKKRKVSEAAISNAIQSYGTALKNVIEKTEAVNTIQEQIKSIYKLKGLNILEQDAALRVSLANSQLALEDAVKSLNSSASSLYASLSGIAKTEVFRESKLFELYANIHKQASPYFGQKATQKYALNDYLEIISSTRTKTLKVLEDKDFQAFIESLRSGDGHKMLKAIEQHMQELLINEETAEFAKETLNRVSRVNSVIASIDAYVEHLSLVKQSDIPEVLQELYLEVLEEFPIRDAKFFMQNFDANASEVIRRIDEKLSNRFAVKKYEPMAIASELAEVDGFKTKAISYIRSEKTIEDELDFLETTYKAKVVPEFSKKVVDADGNETSQYVYRTYGKYKDKQQVFISFKTDGDNPNLNGISNLGFKCGEEHWVYNPNISESDNLLDFYNKIRNLAEKDELVFITFNSQDQSLDYLRTRIYELIDEHYVAGLGDPALYVELQNAKLRNATADELAEIQEKMASSITDSHKAEQAIFQQLSAAQHWLEQNLYYSKINCTDLLKEFDGVPTVSKYYYDLKNRFMTSYVHRQSVNSGSLNLTLDSSIIDNLKAIAGFNWDNLEVTLDSLNSLFSKVKNYDSTLIARGEAYATNGRMLVDGNFYRTGVRYDSKTDTVVSKNIKVTVADERELLQQSSDGAWYYKGTLIENANTANEALRVLKTKDPEFRYAPEWSALNPEQQLSTYPVMINGKIVLQQLEGPTPLTVKKYVDGPLMEEFFIMKPEGVSTYTRYNYKQLHHFTLIAEQASEVLASIADPQAIKELAPVINKLWDDVIGFAKSYNTAVTREGKTISITSWSPYSVLRDDLNEYQKLAILTVMLNDSTAGTPNRRLKLLLKTPAEKIDINEFVKQMSYEVPAAPINKASKAYFIGESYGKLKDLPGYKPLPKFKKTRYYYPSTIRTQHPFSEVYFNKLQELRLDPTVPRGVARAEAYKAYREALEIYDAERYRLHKLDYDAAYSANEILWKKHTQEVRLRNKTKRDYLYKEYRKKLEENKAWWDDVKETVKITEEFMSSQPEYIVQNTLRTKVSKILNGPQYYISKKSSFRRIFEENQRRAVLGYSDTNFSKRSYLDHIYATEERGVVSQSRELLEAIEEVNKDVIESTKAFKVALERSSTSGQTRSVYAPGMQRHATLGMSLINLNNKLADTAKKFKDTAAFDAFLSCDKQVVNNLEDLCLQQVLSLDLDSLISFVQHQGKGIVIIPVGKYLTDTSRHSFDLRMDIERFLKQYKDLDSELLGFKRSGDNIVLYIKDYKFHVKQQDIAYKTLNPISMDKAFTAAYGYPTSDFNPTAFKTELAQLEQKRADNLISEFDYQTELNNLHDEYIAEYAVTAKQSAFLAQHYEDIEELRAAYREHKASLNKLTIDYEHQYSNAQGGYGRTMSYQEYKEILDKHSDIRKAMGILDDFELEAVYKDAGSDIFNFTTLGRANYRLELEPYASSNYQTIMSSTYRSLAYNLSAVTQYAQFYFNDSPWTLKNFFEYASDEAEIFTALKAIDGYTVSTLGINEKGIPIVKELKIETIEDLREAVKLNAIITPTTTFGSISQTLNNYRWNHSKFKVLHKVAYWTKMSMLVLNPGFILRNLIDSTLKNVLIAKNKDEVLSNYLLAIDLHQRYQQTVDLLFAVNKEHPFRPDVLDIVLKDSTSPLTEAQFMMIHNFYENGPSAGSIQRVSDYYLQQSVNKGTMQHSALQRTMDALMKPTKDIEDITRFAAYIEATKRGLTNIDAFDLIRKAHFDYGTKTNTQYWLELIFPFYSFKLKNFEFWLDYASRNPSVTYGLLQLATSDWNWEEVDFERIQYYESQLNHMLQANIKLNEQGLTLKINPSMMDPVNLILNPLDSLTSSVAPWVQPIVDAMEQQQPYNYGGLAGTVAGATIAGTVPGTVPGMAGAGAALAIGSQYASRLKSGKRSYDRTGSSLPLVLPSVFGSVKTPAQYGRASYTNSRTFMDPEKRRPRRVNIYNKYYTDTGKNRWKIRFYPVDAATIQYRIRDNYNRFR